MSTKSIPARLCSLHRQSRNRQSRRRFANKWTRRSIAAPESLECRRLLASDGGFGVGDAPGDEPFPDTFTVAGVKWDDRDANGIRNEGEPGLADVTIYSDLNRNGRLDDAEPWTATTNEIGPDGAVRTGVYELSGLEPGVHVIREVVPDGFTQTFPASFDPDFQGADGEEDPFATVQPDVLRIDGGEPLFAEIALTIHPFCFVPIEVDVRGSHPGVLVVNESGPQLNGCGGDTSVFEVTIFNLSPGSPGSAVEFIDLSGDQVIASIPLLGPGSASGAHIVEGIPGDYIGGINFGNHQQQPPASVHGVKWLDRDGDGRQDEDEPGIPGVTIFADTNGNHHPDFFEPSTITMADGRYWLEGLPPGTHVIREVVPDGFRQTFPGFSVNVGETELGRYHPGVAIDLFPSDGDAKPAGDGIDLALDITAVWPDSCGSLDIENTSHTVVGGQILVELHGHQEGDACAEVISPETTTVTIEGLQQREYNVVVTLHEALRDGSDVPTLAAVTSIGIGQRNGHRVELGPGESVDGIDFGNQPLPPGQIHGTKWLDENGNGQRDDGEPGLPGVTIYVDLNFNGELDDDEPHTVTMESGSYWLENITPGQVVVREVVPDGYVQTFPGLDWIGPPFPLIPWIEFPIGPDGQPVGPDGEPIDINGVAPKDGNLPFDFWFPPFPDGGHWVFVDSGQAVEGINFGNRESLPGSVHGVKWLDENGNRRRDDGEPGMAGVTIYADQNNNFVLDEGELHTESMEDDPETQNLDETGRYWLEGLEPGIHTIREVVPEGYVQTFPEALPRPVPFGPDGNIDPDLPPGDSAHVVFIRGDGATIEGLNFGNRLFVPAQVHGTKWHDLNGNGQRETNEPGLAGVTIYVDLNFNRMFDAEEPHAITMEDGRYWIEGLDPGGYVVREMVPDGFVQTFPPPIFFFDQPIGDDGIPFPQPYPDDEGGHYVYLEVGDVREEIDFGNREIGASSIHGRKWRDDNGNGWQDDREPGLGGVTIYVDANENGALDEGEPHTVTMKDIEETDFDEAGLYWIDDLEPGRHVVREVVPDGFAQTFPRQSDLEILDVFSAPIQPLVVAEFGLGQYAAGNVGTNELTFLVTMGACAAMLPHETSFEIVDHHISVNMFVDSANHEVACDAGIETFTQTIELGPLDAGDYELRALLSEIATDGDLVESFVLEATLFVESSNAHVVHLSPNQGVDGINFGNQPVGIEFGALHGRKWLDRNGNGRRDDGEPGLPGVTILLSGADRIARETRTMEDDPSTSRDEGGLYWFDGLEPGMYAVTEVAPDGFRQTFPAELPEICHLIDPLPGSPFCSGPQHLVSVEPGQVIDGLDFGNQPIDSTAGLISGRAWLDENANGRREDGEPGLAHITIFIDSNLNGEFDADDLTAVTMEDNPATEFNELGFYRFAGLGAGFYVVRERVPDIYQDTFPELLTCRAIFCNGRGHLVELESGESADGLNFGNAPAEIEFASVHGVKWLDRNGDGERQDNEPGLPGVVIYSDVNLNGQFDSDEPHARTMQDNPNTDFDESGMYWIERLRPGQHLIEEIVPLGFEKTFPISLLLAPWPISEPYYMWLEPGQVVADVDFGNHPSEEGGAVAGFKWSDHDGDGERDADEPGLGGVTVFWDANEDGVLGPHEISTTTGFDNPSTSQNEAGRYQLDLPPGAHRITEMVPDGYVATFPSRPAFVESFAIPRAPFRARGYELTDVETVDINADGATVELTFATMWPDSCGNLLADASRFEIDANGRIHVAMKGVQTGDICLQVITTDSASIVVPGLEPGRHQVRTELYEETSSGTTRLSWVVEATFTVGAAGSHLVELHSGDVVDGVNFGNRPLVEPGEMMWDGAAPVGAAGDGNAWDDLRNWSWNGEADAPLGADGLGDDVVFGPGHGGVIDLGHNQDRIVHSLHFMDDYELVGEGVRLNVTSGDVVVDGGATVSINAFLHSSNGEFRKSGRGTLTLMGGGDAVTVVEGVLGGSSYIHQLSVGGMGTVAPGASAGTMQVGSAIFDSGATLEIEIGNDSHDRLVADSAVFLAGQLSVVLMDDLTIA